MKQPLLIDVAPTPTIRSCNRNLVNRLKHEYDIWTDNDPKGGLWLALCVPQCHEMLGEYLTAEDKADPIVMFIGNVRLLEEADLIEEGHKTELAAVLAVVKKLQPTPTKEDK